jgi:hypothetical protein
MGQRNSKKKPVKEDLFITISVRAGEAEIVDMPTPQQLEAAQPNQRVMVCADAMRIEAQFPYILEGNLSSYICKDFLEAAEKIRKGETRIN